MIHSFDGTRTARSTVLALTLALALAASSCSSDDDDDGSAEPTFNTFVRDLIDQTAEDTDPVSLDGRTFTFGEDPAAFDDLFQ